VGYTKEEANEKTWDNRKEGLTEDNRNPTFLPGALCVVYVFFIFDNFIAGIMRVKYFIFWRRF